MAAMDQTLDPLAARSAEHPGKLALIDDGGHRVTYSELNARASKWAHALAQLGAARGDICLIVHRNSIAAIELHHGLAKRGSISTPVSPGLHPAELTALIAHSGARLVACDPDVAALLDDTRVKAECPEASWIVLGSPSRPGWIAAEQLVHDAPDSEPPSARSGAPTLIYTAGSSASPKGVYRRHGIDLGVIDNGLELLGMHSGDVHLMAGPASHSGPWGFATLQQLFGATCVVQRAFHPRRCLELIDRYRVTTSFMVPTMMHDILDLPEHERRAFDLSSLTLIIVTGSPFPRQLKERALDYFGDCLRESYGSTEMGMVTLMTAAEMRARPSSCGRPLDGIHVRIADDHGIPVRTGEPGILWARTPSLFEEYWRQPGTTAAQLDGGFFAPGDVAYADEDGYLYICGRATDVINVGGSKIHPEEIETILQDHPDVADCAVVGVPHPRWGEAIRAAVKPVSGATPSPGVLIAHCAERLAPHKVPWAIDMVGRIPRDGSGKLRRREVRDWYSGQAPGQR
jgi:acyl-coenzyme A synthetase/AMP-(fatty) acid ligase